MIPEKWNPVFGRDHDQTGLIGTLEQFQKKRAAAFRPELT